MKAIIEVINVVGGKLVTKFTWSLILVKPLNYVRTKIVNNQIIMSLLYLMIQMIQKSNLSPKVNPLLVSSSVSGTSSDLRSTGQRLSSITNPTETSEPIKVNPSYRELQSNVYEARKTVKRQWTFFLEEDQVKHSNKKRKIQIVYHKKRNS